MKIVALEEHFVVQELVDAWAALPTAVADATGLASDELDARLTDLGEGRIAAMDDQGVDVQVLSLTTPGVQSLPAAEAVPLARDINDSLAQAVGAHPDRFQGLATVPTPDPSAAADELRRAVHELGFKGAMINGRTGSRNADDRCFDELYATAADLRAPLYLHPQLPTASVRQAYYSGLGDQLDQLLAGFGIGWHYETGVQLVRMIISGVFDRHPDLQVIIGHWGELVLFYLERLESMQLMGLELDRPLADYFRQNVWYTGSGMLSERYLRWTVEVVGVDRVMYSTDYPYVPTGGGRARAFLEHADLGDDEKESIGHSNWERLIALLG